MGLHLNVDAIPKYVRFECPDGNSTFSIHKVQTLPKGNGVTIYFEDDNLNQLVHNLQQKGIIFTQLPEDKSWFWREAHLKDLDGNNIILFQLVKTEKIRHGAYLKTAILSILFPFASQHQTIRFGFYSPHI